MDKWYTLALMALLFAVILFERWMDRRYPRPPAVSVTVGQQHFEAPDVETLEQIMQIYRDAQQLGTANEDPESLDEPPEEKH